MIVLRSLIWIKGGALYEIDMSNGGNRVIVSFAGMTGTEYSLEVYRGCEHYADIDCSVGGGTATAEIPIDAFDGSNIHFRIVGSGTISQFYHIVYDVEKEFGFIPANFVVLTNSGTGMYTLNQSAFGAYAYLSMFTYGELEKYTYNGLRGGEVAENG